MPARPAFKYQDTKSDGTKEVSPQRMESERTYISVVARISTHVFRIEREYHLNKSFIQISDPGCNHTIRPIDLIKLPGHQDDSSTIVVSIFESPGRNYLQGLLDFEYAWSPHSRLIGEQPQSTRTPFKQSGLFEHNDNSLQHMLPLATFLDFAIGASECLELLHHGLRVVHGEIRGDAFYFNQETGAVKIINFGSGPRSFENGLTSAGWLMLSREVGIKNKLQFIAPEQTGRMPAEPDSRTDIYSLGVLFWTMLTRQFAFDGETPLDIVQSVLGRRIPVVSSIRIDVPDAISHIIQKMTQKQIDERYHSISGLKHDLVQIQKILGDGDAGALSNFKIGSKDISSFFVLPSNVFGRVDERDKIVKVIEKVAKQQKQPFDSSSSGALGLQSNSASAPSEGRLEALENSNRSSDTSSQTGREFRESAGLGLTPAINTGLRQSHVDSEESLSTSASPVKTIMNVNTRDSLEVRFSSDTQSSDHRGSHSSGQQNGSGALPRLGASQKFRRRSRCEVITVIGAAGLGKSRLIQNTQGEIRRSGYFASAKFDPARKAPFEPLKRATSSLFRQIFSESDLNSDYHNFIRANVCATWPSLCSMLDLPTNLIYLEAHHNGTPKPSPQTSHHKTSNSEVSGFSKTASNQIRVGPYVSSDFLRGNKITTQSPKFMNIFLDVLRILSGTKLICLCFDDLQYGDEESLNLISNIILRKLGIVLIVSCLRYLNWGYSTHGF